MFFIWVLHMLDLCERPSSAVSTKLFIFQPGLLTHGPQEKFGLDGNLWGFSNKVFFQKLRQVISDITNNKELQQRKFKLQLVFSGSKYKPFITKSNLIGMQF